MRLWEKSRVTRERISAASIVTGQCCLIEPLRKNRSAEIYAQLPHISDNVDPSIVRQPWAAALLRANIYGAGLVSLHTLFSGGCQWIRNPF